MRASGDVRARAGAGAMAAVLTAVALVLTACTGSGLGSATSAQQGGAGSTGASPPDSGTAGAESTGAASPGSGDRGTAASAAPPPGVGEVGGSACGTPHGPYDQPGDAPSGTVTVGIKKLPTTLNPGTVRGAAIANTDPWYLLDGPGLFYYNDRSELINNDSFGTCTLDSLDPLTVTYHINDGVQWSDGVPVTAADLLLDWAAGSGQFPGFDAANPAAERITSFPRIGGDGKTLTVTYANFFVDYDIALDVGVPAHVVAMRALGVDDPNAATRDLVDLFRATAGSTGGGSSAQQEQLAAVAKFFNTGFDADSLPEDELTYISDGAYRLTDWVKGEYLAFRANPDYQWGPKPRVQTIIWARAPNAQAAVASLEAGDMDIVNPRATPDVKSRLDKLADESIRSIAIDGASYEHLDLVFDNGGPFDPATYGGGAGGDSAERALAVRRAFLQTIPRREILDELVKPLNPDAVLRDSFTLFPGQPGYDRVIARNGSKAYANAGSKESIATAKKLLADAGVTTPITVRLLYAADDPRRAAEYDLIAKSAARAGFTVVDGRSADWVSLLSRTGTYDVSLYALQAKTTGVSQVAPNYQCRTGAVARWGQNNFGHYCSTAVNEALVDLAGAQDPDQRFADLVTIDKHLWADGFGTVLFQHPDVVGYNAAAVSGVSNTPLAPTFVWNYWDWRLAE